MKKILLSLFLFSMSVAANADHWYKITESKDGQFSYYLSPTRIKNIEKSYDGSNDIMGAWVKVLAMKTNQFHFPVGSYFLSHYKFTCPAEKYDSDGFILYSKGGKIISSSDTPERDIAVFPETTTESILIAACKYSERVKE